ncbi:MAG: hypothetical protein KAV87_01440, partial [Desulfobacteraceae bacterium]|nr:hypothetical protein [Desulfobacteraceae bacterium]
NQIANIAFISLSNLKHLVTPLNSHPEQLGTMIIYINLFRNLNLSTMSQYVMIQLHVDHLSVQLIQATR